MKILCQFMCLCQHLELFTFIFQPLLEISKLNKLILSYYLFYFSLLVNNLSCELEKNDHTVLIVSCFAKAKY